MSKKINTIINNENDRMDKAIDLLMQDIVEANIYNKLLKDFVETIKENADLFNQSKTFWHLSIQALKDARMIRLCRIFDTERNSISIINLLEAIKKYNSLFSLEYFKIRLKNNPFVDSLSDYNRNINLEKLEEEIASIKANKTIDKIFFLRNKFYAHKSLKHGLNDFIQLKNPTSN